MDALFGLSRKKAAGKSHREPIYGHLFFGDQVSVDEFVATSALMKISKVQFIALNLVLEVCVL